MGSQLGYDLTDPERAVAALTHVRSALDLIATIDSASVGPPAGRLQRVETKLEQMTGDLLHGGDA
jgi:hypothetical protein